MSLIALDDSNSDQEISNGKVIIDFYHDSCMPCKMLSPILESLATELPATQFYKCDIFNALSTVSKFNVSAAPTIVFLIDGKEIKRLVGMQNNLKNIVKEFSNE